MTEQEFLKQVGRNVARYRKKFGLTQKAFAQKAELSLVMVASLECGQHGTTLKTLKKLADCLEISPCVLLAGEDDIVLSKSALVQNSLNKAEE